MSDKSNEVLKARYNIGDWTEFYKTDDGLNFVIPDYKMERLREIEIQNLNQQKKIDELEQKVKDFTEGQNDAGIEYKQLQQKLQTVERENRKFREALEEISKQDSYTGAFAQTTLEGTENMEKK